MHISTRFHVVAVLFATTIPVVNAEESIYPHATIAEAHAGDGYTPAHDGMTVTV